MPRDLLRTFINHPGHQKEWYNYIIKIKSGRGTIINKIIKLIYIIVGFLALGLGVLGIVLPVLPTTPFLLLASFCFVKGSERFEKWFKGTSLYKKHLESFVQKRSMTLKQKLTILLFADAMIVLAFILIDNVFVRIALIIIVIYKYYYFTTKIKTLP